MSAAAHNPEPEISVDSEALLVALVVAPGTYSRNKYFALFQNEPAHRARRRAQMVRSVVRDLTEPWPELPASGEPGKRISPEATIVAEHPTDDGIRLVYRVAEFDYTRSLLLTHLEAAALRYALSRAGRGEVNPSDRRLVEGALTRLGV